MYIGRFVVVGRIASGSLYLGYRVSSRSFPNRLIKLYDQRAAVLPTPDAAATDNPYISYNCFRSLNQLAVIGNGSQVDPIYDKLTLGYPLRDALAASMLALDYERDAYNTPRIAAAVDISNNAACLGFVGRTKLYSQMIDLALGQARLIATYECTEPTTVQMTGDTAEQLAKALFNLEYEKPVTAMAALWTGTGFQLAAQQSF